jgi:predicted house-cleaning noncanonical NTP pyrophosphatase (MazG superfamily)
MAPKTELHLVDSQVDLQVDSQVDAKSVLINKIKEEVKELDIKDWKLEELHSFIKILQSKKLKQL